jgi:hypothetical protein
MNVATQRAIHPSAEDQRLSGPFTARKATFVHDPIAPTQERNPDCYIDHFAHKLPHRDAAMPRPCGHLACDPHTITYFGRGVEGDAREGDYCMVCYERAFPGLCPDPVLRQAVHESAD